MLWRYECWSRAGGLRGIPFDLELTYLGFRLLKLRFEGFGERLVRALGGSEGVRLERELVSGGSVPILRVLQLSLEGRDLGEVPEAPQISQSR